LFVFVLLSERVLKMAFSTLTLLYNEGT